MDDVAATFGSQRPMEKEFVELLLPYVQGPTPASSQRLSFAML